MPDVHTSTRLVVPLTIARTRWMLGFHRRLVRRWEWLMLIPNEGCLPHTSHTAAMDALYLSKPEGKPAKVSIAHHGDARAPGGQPPGHGGRRLPGCPAGTPR